MGLNKITGLSKTQDWMVHGIEHQIGAYTDCPHGVGLAIVSPAYYRHVCGAGIKKFARFAREVWGIYPVGKSDEKLAHEGIDALYAFIVELGIPTRLRDIGATEDMLPKIVEHIEEGGGYRVVTRSEILEILRECY